MARRSENQKWQQAYLALCLASSIERAARAIEIVTKQVIDNDRFYTVTEAASLAQYSPATISRAISAKLLKASGIPGESRIKGKHLLDWMESRRGTDFSRADM